MARTPTTREVTMQNAANRPRRAIASYASYADAQRAVDYLSDREFPIDRVAIVGHGLRYVEQVHARMTTGRAALLGAAQGALIGAFLSALVSIFFVLDPDAAVLLILLYGTAAGALAGAALGALMHAMTGGRRDFVSTAGMEADRYDVVVDEAVADRANELLHELEPASPPRTGTAAPQR
jgi:Heat induced stress protein YflT domain